VTAGALSEPLAAAVAPLHGSLARRIEGLTLVRYLEPIEQAR
jgi:hypothetical protein